MMLVPVKRPKSCRLFMVPNRLTKKAADNQASSQLIEPQPLNKCHQGSQGTFTQTKLPKLIDLQRQTVKLTGMHSPVPKRNFKKPKDTGVPVDQLEMTSFVYVVKDQVREVASTVSEKLDKIEVQDKTPKVLSDGQEEKSLQPPVVLEELKDGKTSR